MVFKVSPWGLVRDSAGTLFVSFCQTVHDLKNLAEIWITGRPGYREHDSNIPKTAWPYFKPFVCTYPLTSWNETDLCSTWLNEVVWPAEKRADRITRGEQISAVLEFHTKTDLLTVPSHTQLENWTIALAQYVIFSGQRTGKCTLNVHIFCLLGSSIYYVVSNLLLLRITKKQILISSPAILSRYKSTGLLNVGLTRAWYI